MMKRYSLEDALLLSGFLSLITKHWEAVDMHALGKPVRVIAGDGTIAVQYAGGAYWRYDLNQQTWTEKSR